MKVLILTNGSTWGGLESHTVALAEALIALGHQATIGCFGAAAYPLYLSHVPSGIDLIDFGAPERRSFLRWWWALRTVKADGAILEKGTLHTGSFQFDCAIRLRFRRYITIQQLEPPVLPSRSSRRYMGGLIPGLGLWWFRFRWSGYLRSLAPIRTVCISQAVRRALIRDYRFDERALPLIPHGVDSNRFQPDAERRENARRMWGLPPTAVVFGSMRRFIREKGLDVLVNAFARLKSTTGRSDAYLVLIGEGPEEEALKSLAKVLGVSDSVVFPGFTPVPWDVYPGLDVFVIPSRIEALGVVVIEAMASGCYVIGSNVGGIPEMLAGARSGALVPPDDVDALVGAMREAIMMDSSRRIDITNRAREYVMRNFDVLEQTKKIVRLLEGATSRPR